MYFTLFSRIAETWWRSSPVYSTIALIVPGLFRGSGTCPSNSAKRNEYLTDDSFRFEVPRVVEGRGTPFYHVFDRSRDVQSPSSRNVQYKTRIATNKRREPILPLAGVRAPLAGSG